MAEQMTPDALFVRARPAYPNFDPVVQHVKELDYWNCRLFLAKRIGPEKYPHFQYKYRSLGSDASHQRVRYLRDLIVESRLWLSAAVDFNDPFDMTARVALEGPTQQIRARFKQLIADKSGKAYKERRLLLDQFMARPRSEWQASIQQTIAEHRRTTGVFSFAGDPRSILMWSHYGDYHTGVCLQFEVARDPATMTEAVPVRYAQEYPLFNWAEDTHSQIDKVLLNKFHHWRYEDEWRIIWPDGAHRYLPFAPKALVGLIFGCKTDAASVAVAKMLLDERKARGLPAIRLYRAEMHSSRYALRIRRAEWP